MPSLSELYNPDPAVNWTRRAYQGSVVVGQWLYLDGGEFAIGDQPANYRYDDSSYEVYVNNATLALDLSQDWDASTVKFKITQKKKAPSYNFATLWHDLASDTVYSYNGEESHLLYSNPDLAVWKFQPDNGSVTWTQNSSVRDPPFSVSGLNIRQFGGASTSSSDTAFYLGGISSAYSDINLYHLNINTYIPGPGLVTYQYGNGTWDNHTSEIGGLSGNGNFMWVFAKGGMAHAPFGPKGLAVIFGGETSNNTRYVAGSEMRSMSDITLFDPVANRWYNQTTSGPAPSARSRFCTVAVHDPAALPGSGGYQFGSYEIFIYGGYNGTAGSGFDEIWVLTLPAFTWISLSDGVSGSAPRIGHTCQIAGNRQMISIGGLDITQPNVVEAWRGPDVTQRQGIAVYDLSEWKYTNYFRSTAAPYTRADRVQQYYQQHGSFPTTWDQPELANVFTETIYKPSSNGSGPTTSSKSNTGAIAGGAVAGFAVLALTVGAVFYFLWRRRRTLRRNNRNPANKISPDMGYDKVPELDADTQAKYEMSGIDRPVEMEEEDAAKRQLVPYELDSTTQPTKIGSDLGDREEEERASSMHKTGARTSIVQEVKSPRTSLIPEVRSPRASIASDFRSPRISRVPETTSARASSIPGVNTGGVM